LTKYGKEKGLLSKRERDRYDKKRRQIAELKNLTERINVNPEKFNLVFSHISSALKQAERIKSITRRPEIELSELLNLCQIHDYHPEVVQEVAFNIKYEGYAKRNQALIDRFKQSENKRIPTSFNYRDIESISSEGREKLELIKPVSFGQASRISGVSPADLSILLIFLERAKHQKKVSRETSV